VNDISRKWKRKGRDGRSTLSKGTGNLKEVKVTNSEHHVGGTKNLTLGGLKKLKEIYKPRNRKKKKTKTGRKNGLPLGGKKNGVFSLCNIL